MKNISEMKKPRLKARTSLALSKQKLETLEEKFKAVRKMIDLENNPEFDYDFSDEHGELFLAIALGEWDVDSGRFVLDVKKIIDYLGQDVEEEKHYLKLLDSGKISYETLENATFFTEETVKELPNPYHDDDLRIKEYDIEKEKRETEKFKSESRSIDEKIKDELEKSKKTGNIQEVTVKMQQEFLQTIEETERELEKKSGRKLVGHQRKG